MWIILRTVLDHSTERYRQTEKKLINSEIMDTTQKGVNILGDIGKNQMSTTYEYTSEDGSVITFKIGDPQAPEYKYDNDFAYDSNAKPKMADYLNWAKSFNTVGEAEFESTWHKGELDNSSSSLQGSEPTREDRYSPYTRDYRESRDARDSSKYRETRNSRER